MNEKSIMNIFSRSRSADMDRLELMVGVAGTQIALMGVQRAVDGLQNSIQMADINQRIEDNRRRQAEMEERLAAAERGVVATILSKSLQYEMPLSWLYFVENTELIRAAILSGDLSQETALRAGEYALDAYTEAANS